MCDPADARRRDVAAVARDRSRDRDAIGARHRRRARQPRHQPDDRGDAAHSVSLVCTCLAEDFEPVFSLLGEMLMQPSLPEDEIATRKGEVMTAIRQDEDNPAVRATESLMALLYPDGHPYGRPTKGTIEVVESLTRERLRPAACRSLRPERADRRRRRRRRGGSRRAISSRVRSATGASRGRRPFRWRRLRPRPAGGASSSR